MSLDSIIVQHGTTTFHRDVPKHHQTYGLMVVVVKFTHVEHDENIQLGILVRRKSLRIVGEPGEKTQILCKELNIYAIHGSPKCFCQVNW